MKTTEHFLLGQLAELEADLDRFGRMLDALREITVREQKCTDIGAELFLQDDATWKRLRRQQAAARRAWLSFNRALEKHRKQNAAPESTSDANTQSNDAAPAPGPAEPPSPHRPPPPPGQPAPQPHPAPVL
jgi:hypothetical protein